MKAFALADRVIREYGEAVPSEDTGKGVVGGFAGEAVSRGDDNGWQFSLEFFVCAGFTVGFGIGKVEEGGDWEIGLRFVQNLFDPEAFGLCDSK